MLRSMSALYMSIPLLAEGQACCSPVHLKKAWQVDGSTAFISLNMAPVLVPALGALSCPFLRTKTRLLAAV